MNSKIETRKTELILILVQEQELENPEVSPDLLMLDGNGILHPNRAGIASHLGIGLFQLFN